MMSVNDKNDYHRIIREMIKNEDEVRNSRNNWFLLIQGFLIGGICTLLSCDNYHHLLLYLAYILIALVGTATSISFKYAAWRSEKAIEMAHACWKLFLCKRNQNIQDYPPIHLLTKGIIDNNYHSNEIGITDWENELNAKMYEYADEGKKQSDERLNKYDCLMPFKAIPHIFLLLWSIVLIITIVAGIIWICSHCNFAILIDNLPV